MRKVILTILDGFGYREEKEGNAIFTAKTPNFDKLWNQFPHTLLKASGNAVGLPEGQMGNSEVGHLTIGSGRVIYQPLERINQSIKDKSFFQNKELIKVMNHVKENDSKLHIFGLLSDGGVHSHIDHILALLDLAKEQEVKNVYVHAFLDGRDTLPDCAIKYLDKLKDHMDKNKIGTLADISGRYYSMDRERMWNLTEKYYRLLVENKGPKIEDYHTYIEENYQKKVYDEFIEPAILDEHGNLEENDGLIFANFRPDRATQLFTAITNPEFHELETKKFQNIKLVTMMPVEKTIIATNAFPNIEAKNTLGVYLSEKGYKVLRLAEASKYPHVTYFFDGGLELDLKGTEKIIVPRKEVPTYDAYPKMSSYEVTDKLLEELENFDVVILNFANCDMVGHTGNFKATVEAVEAVDDNLGRIWKRIEEIGGTLLVTADHGNAELMFDEQGHMITSHTCNKVPFIICDESYTVNEGSLKDIAPTILRLLEESVPTEMTGSTLIVKKN